MTPCEPARPLRVALVCEAFASVGGVQEVVDYLSDALLRKGHQVVIVSTPYVARDSRRVQRTGAECILVPIAARKPTSLRHPERIFKAARPTALIEALERLHPDLVSSHVWHWDKFPVVADACEAAGLPFVQSLYDSWGAGEAGRAALRALQRAARITALSAATRDYFAALVPAARDAAIVLGGADIEAARRAAPATRPRPFILCSARLDLRHKAIDSLIDAFASIAKDIPEVDLIITGDGPDRARIGSRIGAANLGDRVILTGALGRDELWSLYKAALFFAMPSRMPEGLGLVFLESMACGRPVIASNSGGVPEIVRHGETGLLLDSDDPQELARAMRTLLEGRELREQMGDRGRATVEREFTWERVAQRFGDVYARVVGSKPARASGDL